MLLTLTPHPDTPSDVVAGVIVHIRRLARDRMAFTWFVQGDPGRLVLPAKQDPARTDELWKTTCFEAFIGDPGTGFGYVETNFSPSGQWATYTFGQYRTGMWADESVVDKIELWTGPGELKLSAVVSGLAIPEYDELDHERIAISCVIEEVGGRKSYWALAHPPGKPDFHSPAGFVLRLNDLEPA
ncbi:MAG: DOMON-like domain-containing protein [Pseudomonadota bacterium]